MALSVTEREQFLAEPHVGALAVVEAGDRAPLTVPIWYQYTPGGELWINTAPESRKARAIRAAGRFSLLAERTEPTVRYVSVEGPVAETVAGTAEHHRELAGRYLAGEALESYLAWAAKDLEEHVVIRLRPQRWLSADLGAF